MSGLLGALVTLELAGATFVLVFVVVEDVMDWIDRRWIAPLRALAERDPSVDEIDMPPLPGEEP